MRRPILPALRAAARMMSLRHLGFASGDAHASARLALTSKLQLSVGATERKRSRHEDISDHASFAERAALARVPTYKANAAHVKIAYQFNPAFRVSGG